MLIRCLYPESAKKGRERDALQSNVVLETSECGRLIELTPCLDVSKAETSSNRYMFQGVD